MEEEKSMPKDNGYRLLKLKNGDSLIGKITNIQNNNFILKDVLMYKTMTMTNPTFGNKNIIIFRPWIELSNEDKIVLSSEIIAAISLPNKIIMHHYENEMKKEEKVYLSEEDMFQIQQLNMIEQQMQQLKNGPMLNISMQLPPEFMENAEALRDFLANLGLQPEMIEDDPEDEDEDMEDDVDQNHFGNKMDDWSPDPKDYLK
jgi:hypothetical protein